MNARRVVFLGPPGSGKGTQAQRLAGRFRLTPLSSGDTLRREIMVGSAVGQQAARFMEAGVLVPDEVITGVMLAAVGRVPAGSGFILDGFPRTVPQAEALGAGLTQMRSALDAVVDFRMDDARIIERIVSRRVCTNCGASYNLRFLPPQVAGVCDRCGAALSQRVDDREDVIATRLATYRAQTAPLVEYYDRAGLLHWVDASAPSAGVEAAVTAIFESSGRN